MAITKEMLKRCLNEKMQAFCALDKDVQDAIIANPDFSESLWNISGETVWKKETSTEQKKHFPWRLSPDTPTEPEWEEHTVIDGQSGYLGCKPPINGSFTRLSDMLCHVRFIGIIYTLNGVETLRTSIDAAFGVPVRVRFAK